MTDPEIIERARIYLVQINGGPPVNLGDALAAAEAETAALRAELEAVRAALPRWIDAMLDWENGGPEAVDEMRALLDAPKGE